jgi:hypothetical protein
LNSAAFRRAEALECLESYARIIVVHLALLAWFPNNKAQQHWQAEINAFIKTLRRYDNAKKRAHNFTTQLITEALEDEISDNSARDAILITVEGHGMSIPDYPDFAAVSSAINQFAGKILE